MTPAKFWLDEISAYERRQAHARWELWARQAVGAYSLTSGDKRLVDTVEDDAGKKRYNIFWSNVENLKPGMYGRTPNVVVSRRHTGSRDPIAKTGADVLEKVIAYQLSEHGFGSAVRAARDDYLLVGRGVTWARYVPHEIALAEPAAFEGDEAPAPKTMLDYEEVVLDYVHWSDFGHTDARRWEDVRAVWRRLRMTKEMVAQHFGADWAAKLAFDAATIRSDARDGNDRGGEGASGDEISGGNGLATVYEVWDSHKRETLFVAQGQKEVLKRETEDQLRLPRFFPCARPIYATLANDDLFPVSDYRQYRTQIRQIQVLTQRIEGLAEAAKLVGVYDATEEKLKTLFDHPDGTLIPVTNWAALAGKGGLDGSISFVPIKEIAETLQLLHEERDKALADSYQLTGISDLIRGDTHASETATAQGIKDKYISMRFDEKRREIDRAIVNTLNNYGAIICHVFTDETIIKMSGVQLFRTRAEKAQCQQQIAAAGQPAPQPQQPPQGMQPQPGMHPGMPQGMPQPGMMQPVPMPPEAAQEMCEKPTWEEVLDFLRNDGLRSFNIDIETDSTIASDQQAQQESATQFLQMLGQFLQQAMEAAQQAPQMIPLMGRMLSWGVRQFPVGRDLEEAVDSAIDKMDAAAKAAEQNPQQQPPDPKMIEVQGKLKLAQDQLQLAQQDQEFQHQLAQQKLEGEMQIKQGTAVSAALAQHGAAAHDQASDMAQMHADAHSDAQQAQIHAQMEALKAHVDQQTAVLVAHIQNLGKVEVAGIAADANVEAAKAAQAHETAAGA